MLSLRNIYQDLIGKQAGVYNIAASISASAYNSNPSRFLSVSVLAVLFLPGGKTFSFFSFMHCVNEVACIVASG